MLSGDEGGSAMIRAHNAFLERVRVPDRLPQDATALQQRMSDGSLKRNVVILTQEAGDEDAQTIKGSYMRLKAFMAGKEFRRLTEERAPEPVGVVAVNTAAGQVGGATTAAADVAALAVAATGPESDGMGRDGEEDDGDADDVLLLGVVAGKRRKKELAAKVNGLIKIINDTSYEPMKLIVKEMEKTIHKLRTSIAADELEASTDSLRQLSVWLSRFEQTYNLSDTTIQELKDISESRIGNIFVLEFVQFHESNNANFTSLITSFRDDIAAKKPIEPELESIPSDTSEDQKSTEIGQSFQEIQDKASSLTKEIEIFNQIVPKLRESINKGHFVNSKSYMTELYEAYQQLFQSTSDLSQTCQLLDKDAHNTHETKILKDILLQVSVARSEAKDTYDGILALFNAFRQRMSTQKVELGKPKEPTSGEIESTIVELSNEPPAKVSNGKTAANMVESADIFPADDKQFPLSKTMSDKPRRPVPVRPRAIESQINRVVDFPSAAESSKLTARRPRPQFDASKLSVITTYEARPKHNPGRGSAKFANGRKYQRRGYGTSSDEESSIQQGMGREGREQMGEPVQQLTEATYDRIGNLSSSLHEEIQTIIEISSALNNRLVEHLKDSKRLLRLIQKHPFQ